MAGMVILLIVVIGTFYLLLEYIVEKVRLRIEKKAETDESSEEPAEVHDPQQSGDPHVDRCRGCDQHGGPDGEGRIHFRIHTGGGPKCPSSADGPARDRSDGLA
jgi:hypothetical protein